MKDFLLYASVVVLFLVCLLVVLIILMQRPSANAGMGSALGGGAAESVFGGESANVLSRMTTTLTVILFMLSFGLYLGFVAREKKAPSAIAPAAPAATTPASCDHFGRSRDHGSRDRPCRDDSRCHDARRPQGAGDPGSGQVIADARLPAQPRLPLGGDAAGRFRFRAVGIGR